MRMLFAGLIAGSLVSGLAVSTANAANECQSVRPMSKRVACVEQKADKAAAAYAALEKKVASLPKGLSWDDLKGVKVEWTAHPGVCLFFQNWNNSGGTENTARTVLGCNNEYYVFNIRK